LIIIHIHSEQKPLRFDIHRFYLFASDLDASRPAEAVDAGNGVGRKRTESCKSVTSGPTGSALLQYGVQAEHLLSKAHTWSKRPVQELKLSMTKGGGVLAMTYPKRAYAYGDGNLV
jgi:hypothetical protein